MHSPQSVVHLQRRKIVIEMREWGMACKSKQMINTNIIELVAIRGLYSVRKVCYNNSVMK